MSEVKLTPVDPQRKEHTEIRCENYAVHATSLGYLEGGPLMYLHLLIKILMMKDCEYMDLLRVNKICKNC